MEYLKKFIIFCIIIALTFGFSFTLKPQKAKAVLGIEDTTHDIILEIQNTIKTFIKDLPIDLNTVARFIVKLAVDRLKDNIMRWAQGGFRDDNQPFAITEWSDFFKQAINLGSAEFLQEINATALCTPIRVSLGTLLGLDTSMAGYVPYKQYAACSLQNVVDNVEEFWKNPSIGVYGWDTWTALTQPNNNFLGSAIMALQRKDEVQQDEKDAAQAQAQANQGYKNDAICSQTDLEACQKNCQKQGPPSPACLKNCEKSSTGVCLNEQIKNVGLTISTQVSKAIGADMDWLISTTELDQLVQVLFSALTNKIINGIGSIFTPSSANNSSDGSSNPSVSFRNLHKPLTPQKEYELNSDILSSTLGMVKGINRSTITCDKNGAMYGDLLAKSYAEIVDQQSQSLYANSQAVNLKPDYEVLDPLFAPLTVYGYSWDVISWKKYPTKCTDLLTGLGKKFNSTCADLNSGLPPISKNKNCECMFSPDGLTCPPAPYPPLPTGFNTDNNSIIGQKQDFYNSCKGTYIDITQRCSECLKKSEEQCENKDSPTDETNCINTVCNNYSGISGVVDGQNFYNKCSIEAQKANCYSCLKNYFMPDTYCGQIGDYVARAVIKYPGNFRKKETTLGQDWLAKDKIGWVGRLEGLCDSGISNIASGKTSVSLICRILPDFKWGGQDFCKGACPFTQNFTEQQLYDINDNKPNDADCNYQEIATGGEPGIWAVGNGLLATKGKCCKSFNTSPKNYVQCIGAEEAVDITPPNVCICGWDHPECCCAEGWRPVVLTRSGYTNSGYNPYGGDCSNSLFSSDGAHQLFMHMNNGDTTTDVAFIATGGCSESNENQNNTDQKPTLEENIANGVGNWVGDDLPDNPLNEPDVTTFPSGVAWSYKAQSGGEKAQYCIPSVPAGNYAVGLYHDDSQDIVSGIQLCQKCDPNDADYVEQCTGKLDPLEVPTGCE